MDIIIREMKPEDWNAVVTIYGEGISTQTATFQREVPEYEAWNKSHTTDCRMVAEYNGEVIGWTALSPVSSRCVYAGVAEVSIYIRDGYRGKKVGEKLLASLIKQSEKEGYWTLQSGIFEINKASIALHQKAGFRMIGFRERIAKDCNGVWQNTVIMERRSTVAGM